MPKEVGLSDSPEEVTEAGRSPAARVVPAIIPRFSVTESLFWMLRLNRTAMVAMVAGSGAVVGGANATTAIWMTLAGWCLAVGGFSLDFYADRDLDSTGPRAQIRHNPLADGSLSPRFGLCFSIGFFALSLALVVRVAPWSLIPWMAILGVVVGLALHLFETPISRAFSLGILQALYLLMGGLAGHLSLALGLLAAMFFFAMCGGRGMIDIRDFPQDAPTRVFTLPKRYGVARTSQFTAIALTIAFALSLAAYFTGEFDRIYLYLDMTFIAIGMVSTLLFLHRPSPKLAYVLTFVFMMGAGSLICLAMVLGSL